jgi:hypothetical protein
MSSHQRFRRRVEPANRLPLVSADWTMPPTDVAGEIRKLREAFANETGYPGTNATADYLSPEQSRKLMEAMTAPCETDARHRRRQIPPHRRRAQSP